MRARLHATGVGGVVGDQLGVRPAERILAQHQHLSRDADRARDESCHRARITALSTRLDDDTATNRLDGDSETGVSASRKQHANFLMSDPVEQVQETWGGVSMRAPVLTTSLGSRVSTNTTSS